MKNVIVIDLRISFHFNSHESKTWVYEIDFFLLKYITAMLVLIVTMLPLFID